MITADLDRSGLFLPLDPASLHPAAGSRRRGAALRRLAGDQRAGAGRSARVAREPDGRLRVEFRLWDVFAGQQMAGQQFFTSPENWRRVAHIIADAIYERLTGEKGYFDTRVVFVDETGPKDRRIKRLAIMDQDGANVRYLTEGNDLVLTPRFSPTTPGDHLHVLRAGAEPRVYLLDIETGQRELVGDFPGMTFAPRFSPDGQRVVMSLAARRRNANIYAMDLRLAADRPGSPTTPPSTPARPIRPTASQIVFESDRGGSQQLYVMNADGSNPQRITFGEGSYCDAGVVAARRPDRLHQARPAASSRSA